MERISVVVPVLNESAGLVPFLEELRRGNPHEIIVVDGGSEDGTQALARARADRVLVESRGLARQINHWVESTTGDVIFIPYADTRLPEGWSEVIRRCLVDSRVVGGAFRLALDSPRVRYRVIAGIANWRSRLRMGPLGDQAFFVRREAFEALAGYRTDRLLEDLDFVRRLRRKGRVVIAPEPVRSSVRRWESRGLVATTLQHWRYLICHLLGREGEGVRGAYRRDRRNR